VTVEIVGTDSLTVQVDARASPTGLLWRRTITACSQSRKKETTSRR
jgi:hypothetical protein